MNEPIPLIYTHPEFAEEWSDRNGDLKPEMFSAGSHDRVWWKGKCGHEWQTRVNTREKGSGCPYCKSIKVLKGFNDLQTRFPEIAAEWSDRNLPLTPDQIMPFSRKRFWWRCEKGHEWQATAHTRASGNNCPICGNHVVVEGFNDNASRFPALAVQWSEKNSRAFNEITPKEYSKVFRWHCDKCGNDYRRTIVHQQKANASCPYCTKLKPMDGVSDLNTTNPELAAEWDTEKNGTWTPTDVTPNSKKYIWWKCPAGHSWGSRIVERTHDSLKCKTCSAEFRAVLPQWLTILLADRAHIPIDIDRKADSEESYELFILPWNTAVECGGVSEEKKNALTQKAARASEHGIRYVFFPVSSDLKSQYGRVCDLFAEHGYTAAENADKDISYLKDLFYRLRPQLDTNENTNQRKRESKMTEEMKLLLKLLLAQENETEAGQDVKHPKRKIAPEPTEGIDRDPNEHVEKPKRSPDVMKEFRDEDFQRARSDLYASHENNVSNMKTVPIWEKYALTVAEAAQYFHIGTKKLRKIINADKYAKYLIWNGGRVFIKRQMFEEFLNNEIQL